MRVKELAWDSVKVDLFKAEQYDPKYLKLNPKGIVPTLVHDGKPIIESTLICEYLDDTFPEPRLTPFDPWQRTRMRLWGKMVDEELFEGVGELSFSAMFRERMRNMPEESARGAFATLATHAAETASCRLTNSACVRHTSNMGLRLTSEHSSCWRIR